VLQLPWVSIIVLSNLVDGAFRIIAMKQKHVPCIPCIASNDDVEVLASATAYVIE
jgi:hypothetical protein